MTASTPLGRLRPSPAGGGLADELALPRDAPVRVGDVSVGLASCAFSLAIIRPRLFVVSSRVQDQR